MPYRKEPLVAGEYYHLYNRGVEKRKIFIDRKDSLTFLSILQWYLREDSKRPILSRMPKESLKGYVSLYCYVLMPNHFHFLVRQERDEGITKLMHALGTAYVMYFNQRYKRVGSLFQGRFQAKLIKTDEYLLQLSKYIHRNPKEILKLQVALSKYQYSSYPDYLGKGKGKLVDTELILSYYSKENSSLSYKSFVEESGIDRERFPHLLIDS